MRERAIKRTLNQGNADTADLEVYRLVAMCERRNKDATLSKSDRDAWDKAGLHLHRARTHLREMMHPTDQQATSVAPASPHGGE